MPQCSNLTTRPLTAVLPPIAHAGESNPPSQPGAAAGGFLRDRLAYRDAQVVISERHCQREEDERKRQEEYDRQWGPLGGHNAGN